MLKILSDKYTHIAGQYKGEPFSVKLEKGCAEVEDYLAHHIKALLKDIDVAAIESKKGKNTEPSKEETNGEKPAETDQTPDGIKEEPKKTKGKKTETDPKKES